MKLSAVLLLFLVLVSTYANEIPSVQVPEGDSELEGVEGRAETIKIISGILYGAFRKHNNIETCFKDSVTVVHEISAAVASLKQHTHSGVKNGLIHIGKALFKLPESISHCKDVVKIIDTIKKAAIKFSNPTLLVVSVGKNILWHSVDIYRNVQTIINAYHASPKNYFSLGVGIGGIIDLIFIRNPHLLEDTPEEALDNSGSDLLKGFAHGVSPNTYNDVKVCIKDVSPVTWKRIENDIKGLSWKHVKGSIEKINDIGKVFTGVISDCKSSSAAVKHLISQLKHAFDASNFIDAALAIVKHPIKFEQKISRTVKDFKNHKFYAAGDEIGDFVGEVLKLKEEEGAVEALLKEIL